MSAHEAAETVRERARLCRIAGLTTNWDALPATVQEALGGIAADLDNAADALVAAAERADRLAAALQRLTTMEAFMGVAADLRFVDADTLKRELHARQEYARAALAADGDTP